jgi:hypothetical protein
VVKVACLVNCAYTHHEERVVVDPRIGLRVYGKCRAEFRRLGLRMWPQVEV